MKPKRTKAETKKAHGRPSLFTAKLADAICERLASGESQRTICRDKTMPSRTTVMRWLLEDEAFQNQYTRARDAQTDELAEEVLDRGRSATAENANAARVHIDALKWYAGKVAPKKYGDKLEVEHHVESLTLKIEQAVPVKR